MAEGRSTVAIGAERRVRWTYTDDNGYIWALNADGYITSQLNEADAVIVGGVSALRATPTPYCSFRKRRVTCHDPISGTSRVVTLYSPTAPLRAKGVVIQLNTIQSDGTELEVDFVSSGRVLPEGSGRSTTYQT